MCWQGSIYESAGRVRIQRRGAGCLHKGWQPGSLVRSIARGTARTALPDDAGASDRRVWLLPMGSLGRTSALHASRGERRSVVQAQAARAVRGVGVRALDYGTTYP